MEDNFSTDLVDRTPGGIQYFGHLMRRAKSLEKPPVLVKIEGHEDKGATEDKMVGWHHKLNGHEFEQALGEGKEQGSLACCSPWGCRELHTTERLINNGRGQVGRASHGFRMI